MILRVAFWFSAIIYCFLYLDSNALKLHPMGSSDNKPTLVLTSDLAPRGDKPLSEPMFISFSDACVDHSASMKLYTVNWIWKVKTQMTFVYLPYHSPLYQSIQHFFQISNSKVFIVTQIMYNTRNTKKGIVSGHSISTHQALRQVGTLYHT